MIFSLKAYFYIGVKYTFYILVVGMCHTKYQTCPSDANKEEVDPSFLIDETNVGSGTPAADKAKALHDDACTNDYIEIAGKCT